MLSCRKEHCVPRGRQLPRQHIIVNGRGRFKEAQNGYRAANKVPEISPRICQGKGTIIARQIATITVIIVKVRAQVDVLKKGVITEKTQRTQLEV